MTDRAGLAGPEPKAKAKAAVVVEPAAKPKRATRGAAAPTEGVAS